jgi:RNA polymerase sigma-70 factor (ECF subfamily)
VKSADTFLRLAGEFQCQLTPPDELQAVLSSALAAGRATYPDVSLSDEDFLKHLVRSLPAQGDGIEALRKLAHADLFLACACSLGEPRAIAIFEREFVTQVSAYVSRAGALSGFDDDVKQALRNRILVAETSILPRIASYTGRGPLGAWVRMTATRIAADLRREGGRARGSESEALSDAAPDPELSYLKQRYGSEASKALSEAFAELSARDANLLRMYFLERTSATAMATMYAVSTRSIQRWLLASQEQLLAGTKRILQAKLALSTSELESLLGLVESQLGVSVYRLLGANKAD